MRSIRVFLLAMLLTLTLLMMAAEGIAASKEWYREHGVVVINPPDSAPMSFRGLNGQPSGYIIDVWQKWSDETRIPVTFRFAPWAETLEMMRTGEADIHGGIFFNEERETYMDFSAPYHALPAALIINKSDDADWKTIMESYTIGVLAKGYAQFFIRKNYPKAILKLYPSGRAIAEGFVKGEVMGIAGDHPIMGYEVGRLGYAKELIVKKVLYTEYLHGTTTKGRSDLLEIVNEGLAAIDEDEHDKIFKRWFVNDPVKSDWTSEILLAVVVLLVGLGALFYFDRKNFKRG